MSEPKGCPKCGSLDFESGRIGDEGEYIECRGCGYDLTQTMNDAKSSSEERFEDLWKQYWSTFNEDGRFEEDKDLFQGYARDWFEAQEEYWSKKWMCEKCGLPKVSCLNEQIQHANALNDELEAKLSQLQEVLTDARVTMWKIYSITTGQFEGWEYYKNETEMGLIQSESRRVFDELCRYSSLISEQKGEK